MNISLEHFRSVTALIFVASIFMAFSVASASELKVSTLASPLLSPCARIVDALGEKDRSRAESAVRRLLTAVEGQEKVTLIYDPELATTNKLERYDYWTANIEAGSEPLRILARLRSLNSGSGSEPVWTPEGELALGIAAVPDASIKLPYRGRFFPYKFASPTRMHRFSSVAVLPDQTPYAITADIISSNQTSNGLRTAVWELTSKITLVVLDGTFLSP